VTTPTPPRTPPAPTTGRDLSPASGPATSRWRRLAAPALAGAIAAGVSMAVAELVAGVVSGAPSLIIAIGSLVVDLQPPGAKDLVVTLFGTNDKLALNVLIVLAALVIAAAVGIASYRDRGRAAWAFGGFGVVALVAALREPLISPPLSVVTTVVAVAAGLMSLRALLDLLTTGGPITSESTGVRGAAARRAAARRGGATMPAWDRREFLLSSAALAGGAVLAGAAGRFLLDRRALSQPPVAALPKPAVTVAPLTPAQSLHVPGITPIVVPNDDFYRIDTALLPPHVDAAGWSMRVSGMVDHPLAFTYSDLETMPLFEQYVTIQCVSNEVGGDLVGNAKWTGVHLRDVLAAAGVQQGASQLVGRSVDGFTAGFPTAHAMDPARDPMIVLAMNDAPLPVLHGYPARLIVPGLYGYVSATKWLSEIQMTTLETFDGYWIPLGWSKLGPILTQSRIDVPRNGQSLQAGPVTIAGVAWAPDRGVSKVEVSIDRGEWFTCTLSGSISKAVWVQWQVPWTATSGTHSIEVRATDGNGDVQTADVTRPAPDGARGHHTINVAVH
jgi:DMSO/TMAO reductase YedYZ molybdopterin-dependent catalytic subunit